MYLELNLLFSVLIEKRVLARIVNWMKVSVCPCQINYWIKIRKRKVVPARIIGSVKLSMKYIYYPCQDQQLEKVTEYEKTLLARSVIYEKVSMKRRH
jgi:hypothetical protein